MKDKTVEWDGDAWCLVQWTSTGYLTRQGRVLVRLKSHRQADAETEAMLQGFI